MRDHEALIRLQEIDLTLMRISARLKAMPQEQRLEVVKRSERKLQSELSRIVGQRKDSEMELEETDEERSRLLEAQQQVRQAALAETNHRQIKGYEERLSSLAKKLEKLSHDKSEKIQFVEKLRRAESNAHALLERLDIQRRGLVASKERDSSDLMDRAAKLAKERKELLGALDERTQESYERAMRRFGGLAVEVLSGNMPSTCRVRLQASQLATALSQGPITECPYCHRILVIEEAGT